MFDYDYVNYHNVQRITKEMIPSDYLPDKELFFDEIDTSESELNKIKKYFNI